MSAHQTFDTNTTSSSLSSNNTPAGVVNDTNASQQTKSNVAAAQEQAVNLANSAKATAANAYNQAANSQIAQDLANGPAAQTVKSEYNATSNEFASLANSRRTPEYKAANNTTLTHYHSFFWNLLSWKNPRATGITFGMSIVSIFACRYLPIVSLLLKGTWTVLGIVTLAEVAAKFTIGSSVASSVRPRRYYTIPKETLETTLDDVEQLINFFVIETQRIVFAENTIITGAAFFTALISYYLIKLLPAWGFALFATSVTFLVPLVYTSNKEAIDTQLQRASTVVVEQTQQVRDLAAENASKATETVKQYTGDYANLAGEYIGKSRQKIPVLANQAADAVSSSVETTANSFNDAYKNVASNVNSTANNAANSVKSTANSAADSVNSTANQAANNVNSTVNSQEFPEAPRSELPRASAPSSAEHTKPIVYAPGSSEPAASSA